MIFSNLSFNGCFLPQMNKYISYMTNAYFWAVYGANKRIFAGVRICNFAKGDGGGHPQRPPTTDRLSPLRIFCFYKLFSTTLDFLFFETYSVLCHFGFFVSASHSVVVVGFIWYIEFQSFFCIADCSGMWR